MNSQERQKKIYNYILAKGTVKTSDLCELLQISQPTVRKDLDAMEHKGLITREFGKASLKTSSYMKDGTGLGHLTVTPEKVAIGRYAATLVKDGETILLDCGATATEMAKGLLVRKRLRVVTTGVNIAMILGQRSDNHVILSGGSFLPETLSLSGESAVRFFNEIHVQKLFFAANGVYPGLGLTYADFIDIGVKKAMLKAASEVYLMVSSSKVGHRDFAAIDVLSQIDAIITDNRLSEKDRKWLNEYNNNIMEIPVD